jgi:hypothetical protein
MNRVIILESLLALAAMAVLGPGSAVLVELAAKQVASQAHAIARRRQRPH